MLVRRSTRQRDFTLAARRRPGKGTAAVPFGRLNRLQAEQATT